MRYKKPRKGDCLINNCGEERISFFIRNSNNIVK